MRKYYKCYIFGDRRQYTVMDDDDHHTDIIFNWHNNSMVTSRCHHVISPVQLQHTNLAFKSILLSSSTTIPVVVYVLEQVNVDVINIKILNLSQPTFNYKFRFINPQILHSINVVLYLFARNNWKKTYFSK